MAKGLCPNCSKVIDSSSTRCEHCGQELTIKNLPKEKRVRVQAAYKESPFLYIGQMAFAIIGVFLLISWFLNGGTFKAVLGVILWLCSLLFAIPINKVWMKLSLENLYISSPNKNKEEVGEKPQEKQVDSHADEIKKFKELLDAGAISEEEFNKEKEKILNN